MQADGITDHQQQRQDQQQAEAEDETITQFEDGSQALDPDQIELRLLHLGQLRQALAQGFELGLVDFLGRYQDHARQRILRQLLERLAQAGQLLELFQCLLTADPLGVGDVIHRRDLLT